MELSPERVFNLFFKYPLQQIPIVSEGKIVSFISKSKTLREASSPGFFQETLEENITRILDSLNQVDESHFYQDLDAREILKVPLIELESLSIRVIALNQFNAIFRPVVALGENDYKYFWDEWDLPFFIVNSKSEIIYKNKKVSKLQRWFYRETGVRKTSLLDYLPDNFIPENQGGDQILSLKVKNQTLKYRIQNYSVHSGNVNAVMFL